MSVKPEFSVYNDNGHSLVFKMFKESWKYSSYIMWANSAGSSFILTHALLPSAYFFLLQM